MLDLPQLFDRLAATMSGEHGWPEPWHRVDNLPSGGHISWRKSGQDDASAVSLRCELLGLATDLRFTIHTLGFLEPENRIIVTDGGALIASAPTVAGQHQAFPRFHWLTAALKLYSGFVL